MLKRIAKLRSSLTAIRNGDVPQSDADADEAVDLRSSFIAQLGSALIGTVVSAHVIDAVDRDAPTDLADSVEPMLTRAVHDLLRKLKSTDRHRDAAAAVDVAHRFLVQLHFAEQLTSAYFERRVGDRLQSDFEIVRDAWGRTADVAVATARALVATFADQPTQLRRHQLLLDLVTTLRPARSADAAMKLSELPNVRRWARHVAGCWVQVTCADRTRRGYLSDVSVEGIGLAADPPLAPGLAVIVELSDGRTLRGTTVWTKGTRTGVRLSVPLSGDDPLLVQFSRL